ncbi:hypothetical protein [Desulforegula conservatrix]|uniref:hypothetical protein n=1 Tax=Desulforegula conservatrix TaxID=153026 RepID=UPI000415B171|nr:hypothetical protein [Desulforegula conservatrix]
MHYTDNPNSPMTPAQRKSLMVLNQVKSKRIAFLCDVSETAVSLVVSGHARSRKVEEAIAMACGKYREDMFPPNSRKSQSSRNGAYRAAA